MMQAKRIIGEAVQAAQNAQARKQLDMMDETFSIIAESRFKMFTAYQRAGFDNEQAMFLLSLDVEGEME